MTLKTRFTFDGFTVLAKAKDIDSYSSPTGLTLSFLDDEGEALEELPFPVEAMSDIEDIACDMLYEMKYEQDVVEAMYE